MRQKLIRTLTVMATTSLVVSSMALAAGVKMTGTVTAVNKNGIVTVKTEDGKMHRVKGQGFQMGDHVECTSKGKTVECTKQSA